MAPKQRQKGKGLKGVRSNSSDGSTKNGGKRKTAFSNLWLFALLAVLGLMSGLFFVFRSPRVSQPLALPPVIAMETRQSSDYMSRLWGTYRSGVYFGIRPRLPQAAVFGMMWVSRQKGQLNLRHNCDQGDPNIVYSWLHHDGSTFGEQEIIDTDLVFKTQFLKTSDHSWTARISVFQASQSKGTSIPASVIFYAYSEGSGNLEYVRDSSGGVESVMGTIEQLGQYKLSFLNKNFSHGSDQHFLATSMPGGLSSLAEKVGRMFSFDAERQKAFLPGEVDFFPQEGKKPIDFVAVQLSSKPPFSFDVVYEPVTGPALSQAQPPVSGEVLTAAVAEKREAFDRKFEDTFNLEAKGFSAKEVQFAKNVFSNLIGGISYFYGASKVTAAGLKSPISYWPAPLYTAVPSRSFFPRGFLWDEGFHQLVVSKWDVSITKDVVGHWLDLMNVEGWIPREQILGEEALSRVPEALLDVSIACYTLVLGGLSVCQCPPILAGPAESHGANHRQKSRETPQFQYYNHEFVVQHNENANPPTLFLALESLMTEMERQGTTDIKFLKRVFPRLKVWLNWFNVTQAGGVATSYRWRGRNATTNRELNPKTLTSGLDDYPRATHPTVDERHVDLRCWMALASRVMTRIAAAIGQEGRVYQEMHQKLRDNKLLDKLHWDSKRKAYSDYGLHSSSVKLVKSVPKHPHEPVYKYRKVMKDPTRGFVHSFGYVSLFPFLLKLIDASSSKLQHTLDNIEKTELLWTNFGLRSLASSDPFYKKHNTEHDPPYWRGSIWINMNYLALGALHHYGQAEGPHQQRAKELYERLRSNLISNMFKIYQTTGYVWEQYTDDLGMGKGSHPFTGWSSLIVLIMAESY